jgi:acyl-CoA synthetase (NDP forming)
MGQTVDFDTFLRPRSVAVIGASPQRGTPRNALLRNLLKHGYEGAVYPVSPSHAEIEGLRAYKSLAELPQAPDLALIITPATTVPGLIAECGARGTRHAIVFSAGFEETEGGKDLARQLAEAARQHGVAVMGPNCQGVWSVRNKAILTFGAAALNAEVLLHAPIAIVSQSGALAGSLANGLLRRQTGCAYIVSVGNETCLDALDALDHIVDQDDVRAVALYVEGLDDAARIVPIAERARDRGVQIVVLKAGRSEAGQQATASHTGKIASPHAVYADVLAAAGVICVDSLQDLILAMEILAFLPDPRASGAPHGGVTVLSSSGGAGALLADYAGDMGLPLATFSAATDERLKQVLPAFASTANPIDLTGQVLVDGGLFNSACEAVAADPCTESLIVQFSSSGRRYLEDSGHVFKAVATQGVPTVVSFVGDAMEAPVVREFREAGVFLSPDPRVSMWALQLLYQRQRSKNLSRVPHRAPAPSRAVPSDWDTMMRFLGDSGLTPASWVVLQGSQRAAHACAGLQYPVVVKVLPSESEHKTELGLVKLRVTRAAEVDRLAAEFRAKLDKPGAGILVQEMVGEGVEVVLSCLRKTDFGPILSIGSGGTAIELYRDITHLALPTTKGHVLVAICRLKLATLLAGFRGKPAADIDALAEAAVRFGDQFLACADASEFEVNPVIVLPRGQGLRAVDALVTSLST